MFAFVPTRLQTGVIADVTKPRPLMLSSRGKLSCSQITRYQSITHSLATTEFTRAT
jgi:hypothetical protein